MAIKVLTGDVSTVTFPSPQQIAISHTDDSITLGDGTTALTNGAVVDNSLMVIQANALIKKKWDYVSKANTNSTTETFTFKTGGSGGTTVGTVTVVYTDSTKEDISTVTLS